MATEQNGIVRSVEGLSKGYRVQVRAKFTEEEQKRIEQQTAAQPVGSIVYQVDTTEEYHVGEEVVVTLSKKEG